MPLSHSPVAGVPMRQVRKYGIEIDVCPVSGGVWLDRDELDKIVATIRNEIAEERSHRLLHEWQSRSGQGQGSRAFEKRARRPAYDDEEMHRLRRHEENGRRRYRKRGKLSDLIDLFDS